MKLYHGSPLQLSVIKANGFDLGNLFHGPRWSIFCFKDFEITKRWAVLKMVQEFRRVLKRKGMDASVIADWSCHWNFMSKKPAMCAAGFYEMKKEFVGKRVFIYELHASLKDIGIGNDSTHKEFTIGRDMVPSVTHEVTLTDEILDEMFYIGDLKEMGKILDKHDIRRGVLSLFMSYDYSDNLSAASQLKDAIVQGKLKPGDDIKSFIRSMCIQVNKTKLTKRIKRALL